jgi:hypothetical protein
MKKILFLLLTVVTVCSCYNDDDLWDKVNDLDGRVETLETTVKKMNSEITTLQSLVDALNQGKVITNTEQTSDGYTLTFSDGSTVSIKNGKNGTDAPVIGVKADEDGIYYWTITTNGTTEWLPDATNKLKVTGTTPVMGVDSDGYWTVDTGEGAKRINGTDGKPVKAKGQDGDSFFKSVTVNDNHVIVTLADGTSFTLPTVTTPEIIFENNDTGIKVGETKTFNLKYTKVEDCFLVSIPDGWKATLNNTEFIVTAPNTLTANNRNGEFKFIASDTEGTCKIIKLSVYAYEIRTLTFEDSDYKGDANMVGERNWSSLIDSQQYGGPLLYPKNNQLYNWSDANNTFLASELPNGWGDYQYWGGGHAISNYLDMDLTHGDFQHQLAVYYQDAKTGFGGHNGSKNFCVHYGYADNSGYANGPLPYIYFGDGVARVVDHMYVTMTTYLANCVANGNGLTAPAGKDDWVKLVAIGYDEDGKEVATRPEFYLVGAEGNILEWTKWDLSALGKVVKIDFNVTGSNDNGYGFSQPAYFAYDDVAVRF